MITYLTSANPIKTEQLKGFFVGWPNPPSTETHLKILKQSAYVVLVVNPADNQVVGFINGVSDNILSVYLPLLEVLPDYQKQGIGGELVKRMLTQIKEYYMVDLVCDTELIPFYEKYGLTQMRAMSIRNFAKQNGKR